MFWTSLSFLISHGSIGCRVSILWIQFSSIFFLVLKGWLTIFSWLAYQERLLLWQIKCKIGHCTSDLKKSFEFDSTVIIGIFCPLVKIFYNYRIHSLKLHNRYSHTLHKLDQNPRIYRKGSRLCLLIQFLDTCLANDNCLLLMNQLKLWGTHFLGQYNHCCFPSGSLFAAKKIEDTITKHFCDIIY